MAIGNGNDKLVGQLTLGLSKLKSDIAEANKVLLGIDTSKLDLKLMNTKEATTAINTLKLMKKEIDGMGVGLNTSQIDLFVKSLTASLEKVSSQITKITNKTISDTSGAIEKVVRLTESVSAAGKKMSTSDTVNKKTGNIVTTTANTTDYAKQTKDLETLSNSVTKAAEAKKKAEGQNTDAYNASYKSKLDAVNQSYLTLSSTEKNRIIDLNALATKTTGLISSLGLEGNARTQATKQAQVYTNEANKIQATINKEAQARVEASAKIVAANEKTSLSTLKMYTQEMASSQQYAKMTKTLSSISGESQLAMSSSNVNNNLMSRVKISAAYSFAAANIYMLRTAVKELISTNSQYEKSLNDLSRTLDNVTNNDLKAYGKQAVEYSKEFGQPLKEVQSAMTELARAGISSKADLTGMSKSVMLGLNTTEISSATEMTGYLVSAVKQLGMSFQDSEKIIDGWNKLGDKYAVKSNDMAEAMQKAGSSSKNLGIDLNNLNAITVVIGEATQKSGSEIGNAIKTMETRLLRPETIKVLESYGITIMKDAEHFNSFKDIMTSTSVALDKFGEGTKSSNDILDAMGGAWRKNDISILAKGWGQIDEIAKESANSAGYSAQENVKAMQTYAKQVEVFKASIGELYLSIGQAGLMDLLKGMVDGGVSIAQALGGANPELKKFLFVLLETGVAVKVFSGTLKMISGSNLTQWIDKASLSFNVFGKTLTVGGTATNAYNAAAKALSSQMVAGNITAAESGTVLQALGLKLGLAASSTNILKAAEMALDQEVAAHTITRVAADAELLRTRGILNANIVSEEAAIISQRAMDASQKAVAMSALMMNIAILAGVAIIAGVAFAIMKHNQAQKELSQNVENAISSLKSESETINGSLKDYEELSKKTALTTEEKEKLVKATQDLIKIIPGASAAINDETKSFSEQTIELRKLAAAKESVASKKAVKDNVDNNYNNTQKDNKDYQKQVEGQSAIASGKGKPYQDAVKDYKKTMKSMPGYANMTEDDFGIAVIKEATQQLSKYESKLVESQSALMGMDSILKTDIENTLRMNKVDENSIKVVTDETSAMSKRGTNLDVIKNYANNAVVALNKLSGTDPYKGLVTSVDSYNKKTTHTKDEIKAQSASLDDFQTSASKLKLPADQIELFTKFINSEKKALDETAKSAKDTSVQIGITAADLDKLTKSFDTSVESISSYNKLMEDYKTNGKFSAESVKDIIDNHKELAGYLNDAPMLYMKISDAIEEEKNNANKAYGEMMVSNNEYYASNIKGTDTIKKALGDYYKNLSDDQKKDLENSKNLAGAKIAVEKDLLLRLSSAWDTYNNIVNGILDKHKNLVDKANGNQGEDTQDAEINLSKLIGRNKNAQDARKDAESIQAEINKINTSFSNITANISAPGIEQAGANIAKGSKEATAATKALTDATKRATDATKDYDNALKSLNTQLKLNDNNIENSAHGTQAYIDGLTKKEQLIKNELALNKQAVIVNDANAKSLINLANAANKAQANAPKGGGSSGYSGGSYNGKYSDWINDAANKNGLSPALIAGMIKTESGFNPNARNAGSGATGLGQFLASTAKEVGLKDRTDPQSSIYAMASYLKKRINQAGSVNGGIKGYGEGTTEYLNKVLNNASSFGYGGSNSGSFGSSGGGSLSIKEIQQIVGVKIDGIMGKYTKAAIIAWQKSHGLVGDGIVGAKTTAAMGGGSNNNPSGIGTTGESTIDSGADSILAKNEEIISSNADLQQQLLEIPYLKMQENLTGYDNRVSIITSKLSILKNDLELSTNGTQQANISMQITDNLKQEVAIAKEKEAYINREIASRTYTSAQVAEMNTKLLEVKETESSISVELKAQATAQIAIVSSAEGKITEILKKTNEERKKLITDRYDLEKKKIDEIQNLSNKQNTTDDYNKNLGKEQTAMNDINASITSAQRDKSSASGQARLAQLEKDKLAQQEKIDAMTLARGRDINNGNYDAAKTLLDKQQADELKANDVKYSDEEINKMAKDAVLSKLIFDVNGKVISLTSAYIDFENRFGQGMSAMGQSVKDNLIASLNEANQLLVGMQANGTVNLGASVPILGSHANGGIVDYTGLGMMHGSKANPEVAFNGKQAVNLLNSMANSQLSLPNYQLPNLSFPKMDMPNMSNTTNNNSAPIVTFHQPLLVIQNASKDSIPELTKFMDTAADKALKRIMDAIGH